MSADTLLWQLLARYPYYWPPVGALLGSGYLLYLGARYTARQIRRQRELAD